MRGYQPTNGPEARVQLHDLLGFQIAGETERDQATLGIIVALAEEIKVLKERVALLEGGTNAQTT